jgi:hypothetical protein
MEQNMKNIITDDAGFAALEEVGFQYDYQYYQSIKRIGDDMYISPTSTVDELLDQGFAPKGTKLVYTGKNGYDSQHDYIKSIGVSVGIVLTVISCQIGNSSSYYTFEEINGQYNTVMFESVEV